jgi:hypothetical protein
MNFEEALYASVSLAVEVCRPVAFFLAVAAANVYLGTVMVFISMQVDNG